VSPGDPEPGAGEIVEADELDVFRFESAGGDQAFLDVQPILGECPVEGLSWRLAHVDSGSEVFDETIADCAEPFDEDGFPLEQGAYDLTVYGADGATGTYRFLLTEVTVEEFALAIGDTVSPGEPEQGAGEVSVPAEVDVFAIEAAGDEQVFLDVQEIDGECPGFGMAWKLVRTESLEEVFDELIEDCAEPFGEEGLTLEAGSYALVVYGVGGATGTYRFQLVGL
jgi:hypothetical protein